MSDRTVNVLLVEDDEVDVMNVQRTFKKMNITNPLHIARNGQEGLNLLRGQNGQPPQVPSDRRIILTDINMPKMNGIEFLQELRNDPDLQSIPAIVLTTSDDDQDRIDAYRLNVAGYILKPVTFTKFAEIMVTLNKYWALCEMA